MHNITPYDSDLTKMRADN